MPDFQNRLRYTICNIPIGLTESMNGRKDRFIMSDANKIMALYCRLIHEDGLARESNSISNQRDILNQEAICPIG